MTLIQMQEHSIARLLRIPPQSRIGSGALQARMRRGAKREYFEWAVREGYTEKQALDQWQDIKDMVKLVSLADEE